ncbi:MAG TPA: cysteine--tRNA ligase [Amaricoccus sp.]|uniref:cysteine--tRNA ligase n=1 Tax=Amaricoccus sp. TaxID=1872485 RepID=UPI002C668C7C|nr:cysteine--tRNA ligase [Amaricoccus sp.]HMQ92794.1 cysteine--tRNA ligase [Amaricoccus sp.]HMR52142.1 cysteine--tRNA ligase [Amaricoccus sp.]HMR61744.1 cysteine--tRNA ligase [Amaricoccus sp.]HMT98994.1 cysteine--tRNA ligase [Amaricoccus sp.]
MTEITLYNTRTRRKEPLPTDPGRIGMYVCGPTVYDRAHIGNARPVVVFDVLFRLLRHVYGPEQVTYVRNITDVDDKINARAAESGRDIRAITDETIRWYHDDMAALGALPPTHEPRATEFIAPMVAMIETLIAKGHAYAAEGHVLFSVASYPEYGQLARRSLDEMRAGSRVEVAPYKRDPMDFVLWKPSEAGLPGWESPWGRGRPGWHIECSAMAHELLGPSFDIHGGGIDLVFPHHENEVAQSRCAHPEGSFANIWMHNGFLNVEGEKMSKSLGNFFTVRDLLDRGIPGEVIRFVLLSTHYRQPMDFSEEKVEEARATLLGWRQSAWENEAVAANGTVSSEILGALSDDLNTPAAITALHRLAGQRDWAGLLAGARLIGLLDPGLSDWMAVTTVENGVEYPSNLDASLVAVVRRLRDSWQEARLAKDFTRADEIRSDLDSLGVELRSLSEGPFAYVRQEVDRKRLGALV